MKNFRNFMKPALLILLVLCTFLTSCFNNGTVNTETTGTQHEHTTTTPTEEGTNPPETPAACTHTTTTLVGAKQPTCAVEGYTGDKVCNACTEIVEKGTSIAMVAHSWDNGETTKLPTCISTGVTTITCNGCGETKTETIATVPHNDVYHDALDGTHNHTCTTCTMNENKVHTPVQGSEIMHAATCLEDAYKEYTCSDCNGVYKVYGTTDADKATGHTWSKWETVDANCVQVGIKTRDCACGAHEEVEIPVNANNHEWILTERNAATCTEDGSVIYTCNHCQATNSQTLTATGVHSYYELESRGDGWTTQECTVCQHQTSKFDAANVVQAEVKADAIPDDTAFEVSMEKASIEFPKEVVSQLKETADADVSIGADVVADKNELINNATNLTEDQKARLENVDVYDFSVTVNDAPVAGFNASVMVTMPYTLKADEDPDGIIIWYVANDGTIEEIAATYNTETGMVSFSVEHFSFYAVAYKETQEMQCRRGYHDYKPTQEIFQATCESFGYTVYKCSCCNATTLDDIVDKVEHAYGNIIPANPTCAEGDYDTRVCANCQHVLNIKYVRALGHTPDAVATCETPSICTTCHQVITPALGHNWTEWKVVVEPTEVNSGLRRRYCLTCGEIEEVRLAATGNIKPLSFNSYQELLELVFAEALNLENGYLKASYVMNGTTIAINAKVNKENNSYLMLADITQTMMMGDGTEQSMTVSAFYRNGIFVFARSMGQDNWVGVTDIPSAFSMPFDVYMDYAKQTFEQIDPIVAAYLGQVREMLAHYTDLCGKEINATLAAVGSAHTVEELSEILDSFQTVYAYAALKLGYQSALEMKDGVEIPTKQDLLTVVSAFMTATEGDGRTDYTWNIEPLMASINAVLAWFEEHNEMALSEVIYEIFGASIQASNPDLTSWDAYFAYIRQQFPGTMTIKNAVDLLISMLETNEICTMAEIYDIIDTLALELAGTEFDCEAFVAENGSLTLDALVAEMFEDEDATLDMLYEQLNAMLKEYTFGELTIPGYFVGGSDSANMPNINQLTAMLKQYLAVIDLETNLSFAVDANGNLIALNLDEKLDVLQPGETESAEPLRTTLETVTLEIKRDDTVKVEIPAFIQPVATDRITTSYDTAGNLIISGLKAEYTPSFTINGSNSINLSEMLKRDDAMSAELGYDVYVLDKALWDNTKTVGTYLKVGDQYYTYSESYIRGKTEVVNAIKWADLLADPSLILPNAGEEPAGYYTYVDGVGNKVDAPVYDTLLGYVYESDNGWQYVAEYDSYWDYNYDEETDNKIQTIIFEIRNSIALEEMMQTIRISNIQEESKSDSIIYNGNEIKLYSIAFDLGDGYYNNVYATCYIDGNDIVLVELEQGESTYAYRIGDAVTTLPAHDYQNEWSTGSPILDANGNIVSGTAVRVYLHAYVPTYYVKLNNSLYAEISYLCEDVYVEDLETITLPDGNVMYVLGEEFFDGMPGIYGYVKIADNTYVQAIGYREGETVTSVLYRDERSSIYTYYDELYNVNDYVIKNADGSYTIKAELIAKLKSLCTKPGDFFSFDIRAEYETTGTVYEIYYTVGAYMVPEQITLGGMYGEEASKALDWDYLFGGGNRGMYETVINDDGSLSIIFRNGTKIEVGYNFYELPVDNFLTYSPNLSQTTGLEIYEKINTYSSNYSYIYQNGKYYGYSYISVYDLVTVDSAKELIANGWHLTNFSYRYDFVDKDTGDVTPVYDAEIAFYTDDGYYFYPNTITVFFIVQNGQLYALTEAVEEGYSVLRFEGMMPADEYFASLAVETYENYSYFSTVYYNGALAEIKSENLYLYETDENGNVIVDDEGKKIVKYTTTVRYITVNGQKKYISEFDYLNATYLKVGSEVTLEDGCTITYSDSEYVNGTFTFAYASKIFHARERYVMLAGKCYRYDNTYYSYEDQKLTEEQFNNGAAELIWIYMALNPITGEKKYYGAIDFDFKTNTAILTEEITDLTDVAAEESYLFDEKTADGWDVYEISYYQLSEDEWTITELEDGTVFYERDGEGYLKAQDGYYVSAYRVENPEKGESYILCDLERGYLYSDDSALFEKYVSLNESGNILTISRELLDAIPEECRNDFAIWIKYNVHEQIDYYELESLFMMG